MATLRKHFPVILIFIISLPLIIPWLHTGLLAVGDGTAHLFRQLNYHQSIVDGQIPPQWAALSAHGLGAPIFVYNWFLPYSLIEILLLLGSPLVVAVRLFNIFCLIAAPLGMYFWARKFSSPAPSLIASILYSWAPYRLISIYLYGAWGEMLAMTIVPFLGLSLTNLWQKHSTRNFLASTILIAALITSHNLSAVIYLPLLLILTIVSEPKLKSVIPIVLSFALGIGLTSFFWIPATTGSRLIQYDFIKFFRASVDELGHFPSLIGDFDHTWYQVTNPSARVWYKDFSLGLPLYIAVAFSALVAVFNRSLSNRKTLLLCLVIGISSYFLILRESLPLWERLPLKIVTYSYRFFAPATIFLCLSSAMALNSLSKRLLVLIMIISIPLSVWAGHLYLTPSTGYLKVDDDYLSHGHQSIHPPDTSFIMGTMEFLPITAAANFVGSLDHSFPEMNLPKIVPDDLNWVNWAEKESKSQIISFSYSSSSQQSVTVNTLYFPNWHAYIDNQPLPIELDQVGRIRLSLPKAKLSTVQIKWEASKIELTGTFLTFVSFVLLLTYLRYLRFK